LLDEALATGCIDQAIILSTLYDQEEFAATPWTLDDVGLYEIANGACVRRN
jgi:hypothetical protein